MICFDLALFYRAMMFKNDYYNGAQLEK